MLERTIRIVKGCHMLACFLLFAFGILLEVLLVVPVLLVAKFTTGKRSVHMRTINQLLFRFWLWLLNLGGLIKRLPSSGQSYPGPCVVICNHPGLFDVIFLIRELPGMAVMVKSALIKKLPLAPILKLSGYVVSEGSRGKDTMAPLLEALSAIEQGDKFQLFPEGTRSPRQSIRPFRLGAFQIARLAGVPVQPVFIHNHPPFLPHDAKWYFPELEPSYIQLEYWDPIPPPAKGEEKKMAQELEERFRIHGEQSLENWQTKQEVRPIELIFGINE